MLSIFLIPSQWRTSGIKAWNLISRWEYDSVNKEVFCRKLTNLVLPQSILYVRNTEQHYHLPSSLHCKPSTTESWATDLTSSQVKQEYSPDIWLLHRAPFLPSWSKWRLLLRLAERTSPLLRFQRLGKVDKYKLDNEENQELALFDAVIFTSKRDSLSDPNTYRYIIQFMSVCSPSLATWKTERRCRCTHRGLVE